MPVADIRNAAPGPAGQARVLYRAKGTDSWRETAWADVDPQQDFTHQFLLTGLHPKTRYQIRVESRASAGGRSGQTREGRFLTDPNPDDPARVVFTVSTGQSFGHQDRPDGYNIYTEMLMLQPSFFVHTCDIVY